MKFTRQYRRMKGEYFKVAIAACLFIIFVMPFASKFGIQENSISAAENKVSYSVVMNGVRVGVVEDPQLADETLRQVRMKLNEEYGMTVYADADIQVYANEDYRGRITTPEALEATMYSNIKACAYVPDDVAYTVRINDFMVTVHSESDVIELLEAAKNRMNNTEQFQVELVDQSQNGISSTTVNVATADIQMNEAAKVLATIDGAEVVQVTDNTVFEDGVLYVGFGEDIEVIQTTDKNTKVYSVEEALEQITKETAQKEMYEVQSGDCLSSISTKTGVELNELYALNEGLTENSDLYPGDMLVITVPKPEISVIVKEEVTYQEEYNADIVYVDNNSMYQGQENVVSYGTPGYREVIAVVSYSNNVEYDREIINQTVVEEAVPTVVERGTLVPPTFIWPIPSTYITSYFGGRLNPFTGRNDGSFHNGIDIATNSGTVVKASCGGTVSFAGWYYGYGWCVMIDHGSGLTTIYAHLSSYEVSVGQSVSQGQRIALSGNSGNSTGPHLHFEFRLWGTPQNPFNYVSY